MKMRRVTTVMLAALAIATSGCDSRKESHGHGSARQAPEAPPPTPDFTPITLLRTPAGLVLHTEAEVVTETPPGAETTPLPPSVPGVTP